MTYLPAKDIKSSENVTYDDWKAAVDRVFFDVTGIQSGREGISIDEINGVPFNEWYESDVSARETVYWILLEHDFDIDEEEYDWVEDHVITGREKALGVG